MTGDSCPSARLGECCGRGSSVPRPNSSFGSRQEGESVLGVKTIGIQRCRRDQCINPIPIRTRSTVVPGSRPGLAAEPPTAWMAIVVMTCAGLNGVAGCSGRATFLSGGPTVGQLKTSLSHLEYENAQMKRDMAKLKQENRAMEDRLVQGATRQRRADGPAGRCAQPAPRPRRGSGRTGPSRVETVRGDLQDDGSGRQDPPRRSIDTQAPQAPGRPDSRSDRTCASGSRKSESDARAGRPGPGADRSSLRLDDDLDHHTFYTGPLRWAPLPTGRATPRRQSADRHHAFEVPVLL